MEVTRVVGWLVKFAGGGGVGAVRSSMEVVWLEVLRAGTKPKVTNIRAVQRGTFARLFQLGASSGLSATLRRQQRIACSR